MRIAEEAAKKGESNIIMNVLKQVEQENGFETEMTASDMADDDNLLDGFMEGFNDEEEDAMDLEEDIIKDKLEEEENNADDGVWSFRLAATVAVVSLGAAWLGFRGHLAKF